MSDKFCVVGIDQSLAYSGVVTYDGTANFILNSIRPKTLRGIKRLMYIESEFQKLIPATAKLIIMEGYATSGKGRVFDLGELGGIVKRTAYVNNFPLVMVAPGTLKKYVIGKGNAPKNLMLLGAYKKWGISFANDNECDAYSLARIGYDFLMYEADPTKFKSYKVTYDAIHKYNNED